MSIFMTIRIAFKALLRNKLRTGLTMLGMIIGVAAVIAMVALGTGAQAQIEDQIKTAGTNLITVVMKDNGGAANGGKDSATNTFSVGTVAGAQIRDCIAHNPETGRSLPTVNPLVFECNDGFLNDIQRLAVGEVTLHSEGQSDPVAHVTATYSIPPKR